MNEDSLPLNPGQDGPLMDFFLAVAGAWKLLVIVPLVVGVLVGAGMHFGRSVRSDEIRRSQATIYSIADPEMELLRSMAETDSAEMPAMGEAGSPAGADMTADLKVSPLGNGLYQITLDRPSPPSAQTSLNEVLTLTRSRFTERDEKRLAEAQDVVTALNTGLARQQSLYDLGMRILSEDAAPTGNGEREVVPLWKGVVKLASRIEQRQATIARAEKRLAGFRPTEVVVEPTPDVPLPNPQISSTRLGILAALVSGLVLLLVVVIRHRFRTLFRQPAMRNRLQRVLSEL